MPKNITPTTPTTRQIADCENKLAQIAALIEKAMPSYGTEKELYVLGTTIGIIAGILLGTMTYDIESDVVTKLSS